MTDCHYDNEKDVVIDGVNDSIIPDTESKAWPTPKCPRSWWTRILSEESDSTLNARLNGTVNLADLAQRRRSKFDSVIGHDQPRSLFTCSQGMLLPSSAKAASKAMTSCDSS